MSSTRKYLIAGNWKMNKNVAESVTLAKELARSVGQRYDVDTVVCPPFTSLQAVVRVLEDSTVKVGAQNMYPESNGAFTGEISPEMLRHLYVDYVILGHSERRTLFAETDDFVNAKVKSALENRLRPILCVGETLEEREAEKTFDVIETQLNGGLAGVSPEEVERVVIAYEPVWAIGTGKTASPEQAEEVHAFIRGWLGKRFDSAVSERLRIVYGGSMKPSNADDLLAKPNIDGGLIGGAALEGRSFGDLVKAAEKASK